MTLTLAAFVLLAIANWLLLGVGEMFDSQSRGKWMWTDLVAGMLQGLALMIFMLAA